MVISPRGRSFSIDVKGVHSRLGFLLRQNEPRADLCPASASAALI
jgi:hypothetical protein